MYIRNHVNYARSLAQANRTRVSTILIVTAFFLTAGFTLTMPPKRVAAAAADSTTYQTTADNMPSTRSNYHGNGRGYVKYFSPGDGHLDGYEPWDPNAVDPPAAIVAPRNEWAAGTTCLLDHAADAPDEANYQPLNTLAGLGIGHLGVTGQLENSNNLSQYHTVILFDPGNYNTNRCDNRAQYTVKKVGQAETYARWMSIDEENRIVVFAGQATRDPAHPRMVNGKRQYDQGLRREVFSRLSAAQKQRVVVCEYADMNNPVLAQNFLPYMNRPLIKNPTLCPQNPDRHGAKVNAWRPQ